MSIKNEYGPYARVIPNGKLIKKLRLSFGWTQAELKKRAGNYDYSYIERENQPVKIDSLKRIAATLEINYDDLVVGYLPPNRTSRWIVR